LNPYDVFISCTKKWWLNTEENTQSSEIDINKKIDNIDLKWITKVNFNISEWKDFTTSSVKIIKIMSFVTEKYWKKRFKWEELNNMYNYILENYKSELDKKTYSMITKKLKNFVNNWGEIIFE